MSDYVPVIMQIRQLLLLTHARRYRCPICCSEDHVRKQVCPLLIYIRRGASSIPLWKRAAHAFDRSVSETRQA